MAFVPQDRVIERFVRGEVAVEHVGGLNIEPGAVLEMAELCNTFNSAFLYVLLPYLLYLE